MVLSGRINKELIHLLNNAGVKAVGLNGKDAGLIRAKQKFIQIEDKLHDIGHVGEIEKINPEILEILLEKGIVPVISPIGFDSSGMTYNINADDVAAEISSEIFAEKLILITDVPGVMKDLDDPSTLISRLNVKDLDDLMATGVISGGMIPKMKCVRTAICGGTNSVHILNGKLNHCVLLETFTDNGIGSMITY
jgi:acetylglutamate kinase